MLETINLTTNGNILGLSILGVEDVAAITIRQGKLLKSMLLKLFSISSVLLLCSFVQLACNLSNEVTDTLESSTILIDLRECVSLYTQEVGRTL